MVNIFRNDGLKNVKCFVNLKYKKEISVFLQDPFRSSIAMCDTDYWYWSLHLILHAEWWLFNNMGDDLAVVVGNIVRMLLLQALVLIVLDQVNSVMISYQVDACSIVRATRAPQPTRGARNEPARPIFALKCLFWGQKWPFLGQTSHFFGWEQNVWYPQEKPEQWTGHLA